MVDTAVQFSEGRKGRCSHPHDQIFILITIIIRVISIQLPYILVPVRGSNQITKSSRRVARKSARIIELDIDISCPRDAGVDQSDRFRYSVIHKRYRKGIIEETVSDSATRRIPRTITRGRVSKLSVRRT